MKIKNDLESVVKKAKTLVDELEKSVPGIKKKSYLVFSSRFGQCPLGSDVFNILSEFPKAFGPIEAVDQLISLLKERKKIKDQGDTVSIDRKIELVLGDLTFADDVMVELRFHPGMLDYSFVNSVLSSDLISGSDTKSQIAPVLLSIKRFLCS